MFYFLFILLVTAIGSGIWSSFPLLVQKPMRIIRVLATALPKLHTFYLSYAGLHFITLGLEFARFAVRF